jgi:hypothetical protein
MKCPGRQVNARLKKALSRTEMYNFSNFIHAVRFATRDHNEKCIAKVKKLRALKSMANARNRGGAMP